MSIVDRWLLPDGVGDILPSQAKRVEEVRRKLLDLFSTWGYDYVIPPMIEYIESLLTGTGRDLDLKTFKIVDFMTGRTMGVRADMTPQVARIDAHSLNSEGVTRLSYAGTVIQTQVDSMLANRTPLSVGAEMFGDSTSKADIEIVSLMIESL
jgi:ATP phosphoribosyltransferase regulatory subunit